jgi:hypothetical protein
MHLLPKNETARKILIGFALCISICVILGACKGFKNFVIERGLIERNLDAQLQTCRETNKRLERENHEYYMESQLRTARTIAEIKIFRARIDEAKRCDQVCDDSQMPTQNQRGKTVWHIPSY